MDGYIKLWRQIRQNEVWQEKPFSPGQAWAEIMMCARWKDHAQIFMGKRFELKRGQFVTTHRQLARDWGWSNHRVTRFIELLKTCSMVVPLSSQGCLIVTVCNYDSYQSVEDEASQGRPSGVPPASHPRPTTEEREEQQQHQEEKTVPEKSEPRTSLGSDGGTPKGDDDPLDRISFGKELLLLSEAKVRKGTAREIASTRPLRWVAEAVKQARAQRNPGGWIKRAFDQEWELPSTMTDEEAAGLREELARESEASPNVAHNGSAKSVSPRRLGESEDEYLRRVYAEARGKGSA